MNELAQLKIRAMAVLGTIVAGMAGAAPGGAIDFDRDIRPILAHRCYECHGAEKQKNGFRLDRKGDAFRGGDSGHPAIVPGQSGASPVMHRLLSKDSDERMPPKGDRLSDRQIALIRSWIDAGAPWPDDSNTGAVGPHWAFQKPRASSLPPVRNRSWIRNPIDAFVLARLEREKIRPSPEANRPTLIRRLCLDLLGLPPTPAEVASFVADRRPDAYTRLVDALLASTHFGERWGRHWLDLARYADSEGYQIDRERPYAYLFRNWVIDAINRDEPFDQFTVEQLAGDLLPNATIEQKIATGFHRNTLMNLEDGVDREEFRCKARVDRVSTTGAVWLGLTVGCAECHSHKYDPISQREFYQLYAFFNDAMEAEIPAPQPKDPAARASILRQGTNSVPTFVHVRGDFLRPGDAVEPGILSALHPMHSERVAARGRPDRLDLARWLVDPENPLTARVTVNQFWQHLFGRGLVGTPGDFGRRGEAPSHPELLDWLATEFLKSGWSRKAMIRTIVTSATYRQSSVRRTDLEERDPQNILLARQNRFRLEAEIVRDNYLASGGLLNDAVGGPSFRPVMPEEVRALGSAGAFSWVNSTGPERYRRGLYVFAQRTVPYPVAMTFDQANPSETCPRRERSNTPLQALTLLNHGLFVECAQGLARRMVPGPGQTVGRSIDDGFRLCLARAPDREEKRRLEKLYEAEMAMARRQPEAANLPTTGVSPGASRAAEMTALINVAQVLMNLDEFLTRE